MTIYLGNAEDELFFLPENSIHLTVTSPPYDSLRKYKALSFSDFQVIARELFRVTCIGGVLVWVVADMTVDGSETGTSFRQALYYKEIGFRLHDTMIYAGEKPPLNHNRYEPKFEYMFVFSKGRPRVFNPIKEDSVYTNQKRTATYRHNGDVLSKQYTPGRVAAQKVRGNIWWYKIGFGKTTTDRIAYKHPAIFPDQLANDHIVSWSNPGDTVLDPFMGSGTTGKQAKLLGRNFIGIERDESYFKIAQKRLGAE